MNMFDEEKVNRKLDLTYHRFFKLNPNFKALQLSKPFDPCQILVFWFSMFSMCLNLRLDAIAMFQN